MNIETEIESLVNCEAVKEFIENYLFQALSKKDPSIFMTLIEVLNHKLDLLKYELQNAKFTFEMYHNSQDDENRKEMYEEINRVMKDINAYTYTFYYNKEKNPLYIGESKSESETGKRIKDHFRGYSKFFNSIPKHYLERLEIYNSNQLDSTNVVKFEKYLIKKLEPIYNDPRTIKSAKNEYYSDEEIKLFENIIKENPKIKINLKKYQKN